MKISTRILSFILVTVLLISALPLTASASGPVMYGIGFVTSDTLKLRSAPSTTSTVVDVAVQNECIVIVSKTGSWYKVIYNLQEGYMHSSYLSVLKRENAELGYGKVNGSCVNLRQGPSTGYLSVNIANKGEQVYIIGLNNGWYKVIFEGKICYIRSDYVDLTEIPYENMDSEKAPLFFERGKSNGTAVSADVLKAAEEKWAAGSAPEATEPEVTEPEVTEPEVTEPEATEPEATEPEVTEPEATEPEATEPEVTEPEADEPAMGNLFHGIGFVTANGGLRLRAKASTSSTILDTASRNEVVVIVEQCGDWYKVIYNLKEGYMHGDYLNVSAVENAELGYGKITADSTVVYSGPGITYKTVDTAKKDDKAYIIGLNNGWFKVIFGENIGYVPSSKLELTEIPYENLDSSNYPRFFRLGKSLGVEPSADALKQENTGSAGSTSEGELIVATAKKYLGVPYVWGGASPSGFDCSGLVYYVFNSLGYSMYRTPADQYRQGTYVSRQNLQPGDVIFFYGTGGVNAISHVGIYIGDGQFIHSPNSRSTVSIASLDNVYWNQYYYGARRMSK